MILRLASRVGLLLLTLFFWTGCVTDQSNTAGTKVLRVGVTANYPPIISKSGGHYVGVEAEFARKLAHRLNVQPQFVDMPFNQLLPALNQGKIDIVMSGMTVTAMRTPLAQFCQPWGSTGQSLLVRTADLWTYSYPDVVYYIKTRIGVEKGSIAAALMKRKNPKATVTDYSSPQAAADALKAKRIDVVMADAPVIWRLGALHPGSLTAVRKLLTHEDLAWAVRRNDTEMLNAANSALQQWRADGTWANIISANLPLAQ
ncbi:transporter substrate-binding domain-containing protein [soil metagenome]